MSVFDSTAIYPNRLEDKKQLEETFSLQEEGNCETEFYNSLGLLIAKGYTRIVYGDHGPYIELALENFKCKITTKFNNFVDYNNLPGLDYKYYYFWLCPQLDHNIKIYLQIKPVSDLQNAPNRKDGKKSKFGRKEGYADYKRGYFYIDPYELTIKHITKIE